MRLVNQERKLRNNVLLAGPGVDHRRQGHGYLDREGPDGPS